MSSVSTKPEEGFLSGFLVLAFVIFIFGFLVGMVAVAMIPVRSDYTFLGLTLFSLGFVCAIVAAALFMLLTRYRRVSKRKEMIKGH